MNHEHDPDRMARFPEGQHADPTKNMTPEQKTKWEAMNKEHGDKFKTAADKRLPKYGEAHRESLNGGAMTLVVRGVFQQRKGDSYHLRILKGDGKDETKGGILFKDDFHVSDDPGKALKMAIRAGKDWAKKNKGKTAARKYPKGQCQQCGEHLNSDDRRWLGKSTDTCRECRMEEYLKSNKGKGKKKGGAIPGVPDGSGPCGGTPDCQMLDDEFDVIVASLKNASVGSTIEEQLGGWQRLRAMLGAYYRQYLNNGYEFGWPNKQRAKGNHLKITLRPDDTYDVEFFNTKWMSLGRGQRLPEKSKLVKKIRGVYADQLGDTFYAQTGWALRLGCDCGDSTETVDDLMASFDKYTRLGDDFLALDDMLIEDEGSLGNNANLDVVEDDIYGMLDDEVLAKYASSDGGPDKNGSTWKLATHRGPKQWHWASGDVSFQVRETKVGFRLAAKKGTEAMLYRRASRTPVEMFSRAAALWGISQVPGQDKLATEWLNTGLWKDATPKEAGSKWNVVVRHPLKAQRLLETHVYDFGGEIVDEDYEGNGPVISTVRFKDQDDAFQFQDEVASRRGRWGVSPPRRTATYEPGEVTKDGYEPGKVVTDTEAVKESEGSAIPDGNGNAEKRAAKTASEPSSKDVTDTRPAPRGVQAWLDAPV